MPMKNGDPIKPKAASNIKPAGLDPIRTGETVPTGTFFPEHVRNNEALRDFINQRVPEGLLATVKHATRNHATDAEYRLTWHYDFEGVTIAHLILRTAKQLVINCGNRGRFKAANSREMTAFAEMTVSVADVESSARQAVTPAKRRKDAKAAIERLSEADRAELLAELLAERDKDSTE